jgi:hypothetical protein
MFLLLGAATWAALAVVAWVLCRPRHRAWRTRAGGVAWFLASWLALEIAGYFALSPFPAARRVLGVATVATLLAGRLAARTCCSPGRRNLVRSVALGTVLLGLLFYAVDFREAVAQQEAVLDAAAWVRARQPGAAVWYVGHWGFQFYAEGAGMRPVVPGRSCLHAGDWLVMPDRHIDQQPFVPDPERTELVARRETTDPVPLHTVICYYAYPVPLEHRTGPRVEVVLLKVVRDWVPATPPSPDAAGSAAVRKGDRTRDSRGPVPFSARRLSVRWGPAGPWWRRRLFAGGPA